MAKKTTFIKIDRNIINWRWFSEPKTLQVFIWLLVNANISSHYFSGAEIKRGQVATSYSTICKDCNLSKQNVITAIKHLKQSGEVTTEIFRNFQIITVTNYQKYQEKEQKGFINEL